MRGPSDHRSRVRSGLRATQTEIGLQAHRRSVAVNSLITVICTKATNVGLDHEAGWALIQPRPGIFEWTSPADRVYRTNGDDQNPPEPPA